MWADLKPPPLPETVEEFMVGREPVRAANSARAKAAWAKRKAKGK
jgi:hypothetical protein